MHQVRAFNKVDLCMATASPRVGLLVLMLVLPFVFLSAGSTPSVWAESPISKTADAPRVSAGSSIGFTITVTSTGEWYSVYVTDPLPGGIGISWSQSPVRPECSIRWEGSPPYQYLLCTPGNLLPGAIYSVHVTSSTTKDSCGVYYNTAELDAVPGVSGRASASTEVICPAVGGGIYSVNKLALLTPYLALLALLGAVGLAFAARRRRII